MVTRCGYFVADNKIHCKRVQIDWDLGFTKEAKQRYIERIIKELGEDFKPAVDVTTASPIWDARGLSPFFVKTASDVNIEDAWAAAKEKLGGTYIPGAFEFLYLNNISESQRSYVYSLKTFIDVFHNPDNGSNTQARSLCVLQMLYNANKLEVLKDSTSFLDWYTENCLNTVLE